MATGAKPFEQQQLGGGPNEVTHHGFEWVLEALNWCALEGTYVTEIA
jgi:hypothetical protein